MFRLIFVMMMAIGLAGCTQAQRFALAKNAELDECAMKRMAESKINGQHGYLQAHHECHQIVNFRKFQEMRLERQPQYVKQDLKDPLDEYGICWEFVKGLYIDERYPEMKMPKKGPWGRLPVEGQKELEERNAKLKVLPDRLKEISNAKLIEIYELMAVKTTMGHANDTLCKSTRYHELESVIGLELKRRRG
ncbi:hypothetical protein [Methylomicrobium sp. Wu6]|uniref:hypothetical protein n=1 Tax=Methylomicrobium sp. Wu6 TaxID=3107928 RepID=UPI002DD668C5|nr:hypothetical protein [Methylomicrobium sp. Wu6]MEC4749854.1 hypothetical protein [Methylomicrobium sp. Wu6]